MCLCNLYHLERRYSWKQAETTKTLFLNHQSYVLLTISDYRRADIQLTSLYTTLTLFWHFLRDLSELLSPLYQPHPNTALHTHTHMCAFTHTRTKHCELYLITSPMCPGLEFPGDRHPTLAFPSVFTFFSIVSFVLPECETQAQPVLVSLKVNSNLPTCQWAFKHTNVSMLQQQLLQIGSIHVPKTLIVLRLASIILSHSTSSLCYCSSFQGRSCVLGHVFWASCCASCPDRHYLGILLGDGGISHLTQSFCWSLQMSYKPTELWVIKKNVIWNKWTYEESNMFSLHREKKSQNKGPAGGRMDRGGGEGGKRRREDR